MHFNDRKDMKMSEEKSKNLKSKDFNIYYLNFSKVYEIAMMINNIILTKIERDNTTGSSEEYSVSSELSAQGSERFLMGIKASMSSNAKETYYSSQKVVESLDVQTTKSILLRRIIDKCSVVENFEKVSEGDLIKIDGVKFELFDEESLRQFLFLKRDALKGMRVEGVEVNNLVASMLQDYAYILKGTIPVSGEKKASTEIMIKIPMDVKSEFESQYSIDDLLIGHVSVVGIYKGIVEESFISSSTYSYLQEVGARQNQTETATSKIIKSNTPTKGDVDPQTSNSNTKYRFIDILAVIQDVAFDYDPPKPKKKLHWWNKLGIWLSNWCRK